MWFLAGQAVDETQERLEVLSGELDDMCRRLGMGDSFQVGRIARWNDPRVWGFGARDGGEGGGGGTK